MNESTAIVRRQDLTPSVLQMVTAIAPAMAKSRLFGVATEEQAIGVMIKGYELGFSLSASFAFIVPIPSGTKTIPTLVPKGMMALILNSPVYESHTITDEVDKAGKPFACKVTMKRKGGIEYTVRFTMEDAARAGLVKTGGAWEAYPQNMLRWRAIGFCADIVFPDVIGGMKRSDELGADLTPDGEVIEGSWTRVTPQPTPVPTPAQPAALTLQALVNEYGAAAVMAANNGVIPGSADELEAVAAALAVGSDAQ